MSNRPVVTASWMEGKRMQWEVIFSAAPSGAPSLYVEYTTKDGKRVKAVLKDQRILGQAVRGWIYPVDEDAAWSYENAIDSIDALGSDLDDGWSMLLSDGMDWSELPLSLRPDLMTEDGLGDVLEGVDRESVTFRTVVGRTTYINAHNGEGSKSISAEEGFSATEAVQLAITNNGLIIDTVGEIDFIRADNPIINKATRESMVNDASQHIDKCFQYFISPDGRKQYLYLNDGQSPKFVEYDEPITINSAYVHDSYLGLTKDEGILSYDGYLIGESTVHRSEEKPIDSIGHHTLSDSNYLLTHSQIDFMYRGDVIDTVEDVIGNPASWENMDIVNKMHLTYGVVSESASSITFEPDSIFKAVYHDGKLTDVSYGETVSVTPGKMIMCMVSTTSLDGVDNFLSAIDVLEKPIPIDFSTRGFSFNVTVLNKDFKAPNGVFEPLTPYGAKNITFHGSTFTVAPRVFSTLEHFSVFPPLHHYDQDVKEVWEPFRNCPNVEQVDNQGVLTKNTIALLPTALALYDPDHMDNPLGVNVGPHTFDGYPTFDEDCKPKVVDRYVSGPAIRWDSSGETGNTIRKVWPTAELPTFNTDEIVYWNSPYMIEWEILGKSEFGHMILPILPQDCKKLRYFHDELPDVVSMDNTFGFIYGARLFGMHLPESTEVANFKLKRVTATYLDDLDGVSNNYVSIARKDLLDGYALNELNVISTLNDDINHFLAPSAPPNLRVAKEWYALDVVGIYYFNNIVYSIGEYEHFPIATVPDSVEQIDGYCNNLFSGCNLKDPVVIPAISSSASIVNDYLYRTFAYSTTTKSRELSAFLDHSTYHYYSSKGVLDVLYGQRMPDTDVHNKNFDNEVYEDIIPMGRITVTDNTGLTANTERWMYQTYKGARIDVRSETLLHPCPDTGGVPLNPFFETLDINDEILEPIDYDVTKIIGYSKIRERWWYASFAPANPLPFNMYPFDLLEGFNFLGGAPFGESRAWYGSVSEARQLLNSTISEPIIPERVPTVRIPPTIAGGSYYDVPDGNNLTLYGALSYFANQEPRSKMHIRLP